MLSSIMQSHCNHLFFPSSGAFKPTQRLCVFGCAPTPFAPPGALDAASIRSHGLVGNFHMIGTISEVFNIRGMGLYLYKLSVWFVEPMLLGLFGHLKKKKRC
jgi:hypothetical protein